MGKVLLHILFLMSACICAKAEKRVTFITPDIVRIQWSPDGQMRDNLTGVCVYRPTEVKVKCTETDSTRIFSSSELTVEMNLKTDALTFRRRRDGRMLLAENPLKPHEHEETAQVNIVYDETSARSEETANGRVTVKDIISRDTIGVNHRFRVNFLFDATEALYGLGSHMEDYMNLTGKTVYLTQHNLKATVPVLNSTGGYGLLFDAGCAMKFSCSNDSMLSLLPGSMELDAASSLDYYFIMGERMEDVADGYRYLTGSVSMMPRHLFGYIQSKERYVSSDDIVGTLREYRRRHVPIDMIVQDWNYWPEGWGYMKMDRRYYPDPKALADSVHAMNAKLMVSIWPNPQYCPQERDFRSRGFMLEHSVYDVFNPEAQALYWQYARDEFFANGFDAWWCDSSEPVDGDWNRLPLPENGIAYGWNSHERRWRLSKEMLSSALGAQRSNLYSLYHSMGIYEHQRMTSDAKRVVNLTRSSYAGQQRYGTIVRNGDTHASWESFRQQIPSGLNYMATGCPYWTVDIGSFFTRNDGRWFYRGEFPDGVKDDVYKEYYTRMLQWAAFLPVMRSHGTDTPREIWRFGEPGTPYYDAILDMIRLRYSLVPYIYSLAYAQTTGGYTMARPLAFDFPRDRTVHDIKDEYMFGGFLVCPVTSPGVTSRRVYLPELQDGGTWTDFWSGDTFEGGMWIDCSTPLRQLPLFVVSGTIVTSTEPCEYTSAQIGRPLTLTVYGHSDASFNFYEDSGDGYGYERGQYTLISLKWNHQTRTMEIGKAQGSFKSSVTPRTLTINTPYGSRTVIYKGKNLKVKI